MLIQNGDEGTQRMIEHGIDRCRIGIGGFSAVAAVHLYARDLDRPDDVANANRCRRLCQPDTAIRSSDGRNEPGMREDVNDLEDVLLGYAEPIRHLGDLYQLVFGQGAIDQNSNCVTGLLRQAHIGYPGPRGRGSKVRQPACFTTRMGVARAASPVAATVYTEFT